MSKYLIKMNQDRCISCHACEVHCKVHNNVPTGAFLGKLITHGPVNKKGLPQILNMFMPCFHCAKPWCVDACPTGAMYKSSDSNIVAVDPDLCVGCKACITACPWEVPQWNEETGRVIKCDFCQDRLAEGLEPACVTGCTAKALTFVDANANSRKTREEYGTRILKKKL